MTDLTTIAVGGAVLLIFIAAIVIAILRWWEESDGFTHAFVAICCVVILGALAVIYWQVTLTMIGFGLLAAGVIYLLTHYSG
jgi:hypothetical protein